MSDLHYLAVRRDHYGNLIMLRKPGSEEYAWNLTEGEAQAASSYVLRNHTKVHGQTYLILPYTKGTLRDFLRKKQINY